MIIPVPIVTDSQTIFMSGAKDIFDDLAWQFAAFRQSGICALEHVDEISPTSIVIEAWRLIDQGVEEGNFSLVVEGNRLLAFREQNDTIQPMWDAINGLDGGTGILADIFSVFAANPVPDGDRFELVIPGGDITDKDDRWQWAISPGIGIWEPWVFMPIVDKRNIVEIPLRERAAEFTPFGAVR